MRLSWQDWTADSASRRAGSVGPFYLNVFPLLLFSLSLSLPFPSFPDASRRENELSLIRAKVLGARAGRAARLALFTSRVFPDYWDSKKKKKRKGFVDGGISSRRKSIVRFRQIALWKIEAKLLTSFTFQTTNRKRWRLDGGLININCIKIFVV